MTLKNIKAQTAVEYIMIFIVLAITVIFLFNKFVPRDKEVNNANNIFGGVADRAITEINK